MNKKLKNEALNRQNIEAYKAAVKIPVVVVLDNIRSRHNIGSVFRTADAFLIEAVYLCGYTATPPHRDIQKTALGATDSVRWEYYKNTLDAIHSLKDEGYNIASIEQTEKSVKLGELNLERDRKYALVFGNEIHGVSQEVVNASDLCIEIPQFGTKHSLNIAVATGVVLWDITAKWRDAMK